jgi:hypothetical protein
MFRAQYFGPIFKGEDSSLTELLGCPETSVTDCQSTLGNIPGVRRSACRFLIQSSFSHFHNRCFFFLSKFAFLPIHYSCIVLFLFLYDAIFLILHSRHFCSFLLFYFGPAYLKFLLIKMPYCLALNNSFCFLLPAFFKM